MATKPEGQFIAKIHKGFPKQWSIYAEKTANPFRGGTPDCVYEGKEGYHWIEYKWLERRPKTRFTPKLTPLQVRWLTRAYKKNRDPWVVVGFPGGCYILPEPTLWEGSIEVKFLAVYTVNELCEAIRKKVSTTS